MYKKLIHKTLNSNLEKIWCHSWEWMLVNFTGIHVLPLWGRYLQSWWLPIHVLYDFIPSPPIHPPEVFSQKKGGHIASHWYWMLGTIKQVLPFGLPIMCNFCSFSLQRSPRKGHNISCFLYFYSYIQLSSTFINDIFFPIFSQKSCVFPPKCLSPRSAHNPSAAGPREVLWGVWQPPEPAHWVLVPLPVLQSLAGRPARLDVCHFYHRCVFCLCLSCQRFV